MYQRISLIVYAILIRAIGVDALSPFLLSWAKLTSSSLSADVSTSSNRNPIFSFYSSKSSNKRNRFLVLDCYPCHYYDSHGSSSYRPSFPTPISTAVSTTTELLSSSHQLGQKNKRQNRRHRPGYFHTSSIPLSTSSAEESITNSPLSISTICTINEESRNSNITRQDLATVQVIPLQKATKYFQSLLEREEGQSIPINQRKVIAVEGYIVQRRTFGSALAFVDLVSGATPSIPIREHHDGIHTTSSTTTSTTNKIQSSSSDTTSTSIAMPTPMFQILLKRQDYNHNPSKSSFTSILKSLHAGTKVKVYGTASNTNNPGEVVMLVSLLEIQRVSENPQHIRGMLQRIDLSYTYDEVIEDEETGRGLLNVTNVHVENNTEMNGLSLREMSQACHVDPSWLQRVLTLKEDIDSSLLSSNHGSMTKSRKRARKRGRISDSTKNQSEQEKIIRNEASDLHQQPTTQQKKVPYGKIARYIITDHLPSDKNYPKDILASRGNWKKQQRGEVLPRAPQDVQKLPSTLDQLIKDGKHHMQNEDGDQEWMHDGVSSVKDLYRQDVEDQESTISCNLPCSEIRDVTMTGWVQNRRRFRDSITILEVVDSNDDDIDDDDSNQRQTTDTVRAKCILHPDCILRNKHFHKDRLTSDVYSYLFAPGSRVLLRGYWVSHDISNSNTTSPRSLSNDSIDTRPVLWVTHLRLARSSWRPSVIRHFLDLLSLSTTVDESIVSDGDGGNTDIDSNNSLFDLNEVAEALELSGGYKEALELRNIGIKEGETGRQWRAAELSRKLQDVKSRVGTVTEEMYAIMDKYSDLRSKWPLQHVEYNPTPAIESDQSSNLLREGSQGSRWERAKRPQLEWLIQQIRELVQAHPDYGKRPLCVLDVGGGKGHLANHILSSLGDDKVQLNVIDINPSTIRNGLMRSRKGSLAVRYAAGDASNVEDIRRLIGAQNVDLVVALHACGTLTDVALSHACNFKAAFAITPCCFRSNPHLLIPRKIEPYQLYSSTLDDNPELISQQKWLGIDQNDMDMIQRIAETQGDIQTASVGIHTLSALRARAIQTQSDAKDIQLDLQIKTFPIGFSTRNHCIIGKKIQTQ